VARRNLINQLPKSEALIEAYTLYAAHKRVFQKGLMIPTSIASTPWRIVVYYCSIWQAEEPDVVSYKIGYTSKTVICRMQSMLRIRDTQPQWQYAVLAKRIFSKAKEGYCFEQWLHTEARKYQVPQAIPKALRIQCSGCTRELYSADALAHIVCAQAERLA
jgi:hypothetical protein